MTPPPNDGMMAINDHVQHRTDMYVLSRGELEAAIAKCVKAAIQEEFAELGIPISTAEQRLEVANRFKSLNKWASTIDSVASTIGRTVLVSITVGAIGVIGWMLRRFVVN